MYYDGKTLLSKTDINGKRPELLMCVINRTAGKTTYYNHMVMEDFIHNHNKFVLLYRYKYELSQSAEKFGNDISQLYYGGVEFKTNNHREYAEIIFDGEVCGYSIALNNSTNIKKLSHIFNTVKTIIFDEFQPENNVYLPDEISKFLSIHTSIARGNGKQRRFVRVIMISNPITMLNPYYTALGINKRLKKDTKYLRGDGFVLEHLYHKEAANKIKESGIINAFNKDIYAQKLCESGYLFYDESFIVKKCNINKSVLSYITNKKRYTVYLSDKYIYVSSRYDKNTECFACTTSDMDIDCKKANHELKSIYRTFFNQAKVRFSDLSAKESFYDFISY